MGLFDKKYCDICGEKIGLLGNRKLEDGNLCKNCAKKLSPFFSERRHSTVEDIKKQLAYREENEKQLNDFYPDKTFGESKKVYIDSAGGRFIVTNMTDWRKYNPDLIELGQVRSVNTDIHENKTEIYYKDEEGNRKSYNPRRYECDYEFNVTILVDSPWFDEIKLELSDGNRPDSRYTDLYREYERQMHELTDCLLNKGAVTASIGENNSFVGAAAVQSAAAVNTNTGGVSNGGLPLNMEWICPSCQFTNGGGKFCQNCGTTRPAETSNNCRCANCGWTPAPSQNTPKFCPECGTPMS